MAKYTVNLDPEEYYKILEYKTKNEELILKEKKLLDQISLLKKEKEEAINNSKKKVLLNKVIVKKIHPLIESPIKVLQNILENTKDLDPKNINFDLAYDILTYSLISKVPLIDSEKEFVKFINLDEATKKSKEQYLNKINLLKKDLNKLKKIKMEFDELNKLYLDSRKENYILKKELQESKDKLNSKTKELEFFNSKFNELKKLVYSKSSLFCGGFIAELKSIIVTTLVKK